MRMAAWNIKRSHITMTAFVPFTPAAGQLTHFPPVERWDDWSEYDPAAWPKKVTRRRACVCSLLCGDRPDDLRSFTQPGRPKRAVVRCSLCPEQAQGPNPPGRGR